jgi:hypothetical protein
MRPRRGPAEVAAVEVAMTDVTVGEFRPAGAFPSSSPKPGVIGEMVLRPSAVFPGFADGHSPNAGWLSLSSPQVPEVTDKDISAGQRLVF